MPTHMPDGDDVPLDELDIPEVWPAEDPPEIGISERMVQATRPFLVRLDTEDQGHLAQWLRSLVALRDAPMNFRQKVKVIAREMGELRHLLPVMKKMGKAMAETVKTLAWDDRTWGFRMGAGVAAITAATVGGKKAGLAMLGTAVAIPAWVVFGAGGAFAGMVIDELERLMAQGRGGSGGKTGGVGPPGGGTGPIGLAGGSATGTLPASSSSELRRLPPGSPLRALPQEEGSEEEDPTGDDLEWEDPAEESSAGEDSERDAPEDNGSPR